MTKTGPNNASGVVWAVGECVNRSDSEFSHNSVSIFFSYFMFLDCASVPPEFSRISSLSSTRECRYEIAKEYKT